MISVENLNNTFKKYPITVSDKGWIYGVWYCGTSFVRSLMYGQHPPTYLKRLTALFPDAKVWLHAPSGVIDHCDNDIKRITVDMVSRKENCPQIISDVVDMPLPDHSIDIIETDPPYGREHEDIYGTGKYPRKKAMKEFHRLLKPDGYLCWLDVRYPSYKRKEWKLIGLIAVVTGFERVTRICSIFQPLSAPTTQRRSNDN